MYLIRWSPAYYLLYPGGVKTGESSMVKMENELCVFPRSTRTLEGLQTHKH